MESIRRSLTLIAFVLVSSLPLSGQAFPTGIDCPEWQYDVFDVAGNYYTTTYTVSPAQETVCGEYWWKVLGQSTMQEDAPTFTLGYYRQDGERYYFRRSTDCTERTYLMFDFSAEIGDTLYVGIPAGSFYGSDLDTLPTLIYQIDSVFYGPTLRRRIVTTSGTWIEGIGSTRFPLPPLDCPPGAFACEIQYTLECLTTKQGVIYANENNSLSSCSYPLSHLTKLYVNKNTPFSPATDGSSWEKAFPDLQQALALADYGDTVWVAAGTYLPTTTTDRNVSFVIPNGVQLFGGFAGNESTVSERQPAQSPTVLSGNIGNPQDSTDNSYHVIYGLGLDRNTIIDGFTISHGQAFISETHFGPEVQGGGIFLDANSEYPNNAPVIRNCVLSNNLARNGGGIHLNGNLSRAVVPQIEDCRFSRNTGLQHGGAIYRKGTVGIYEQQTIRNCYFENNKSNRGGASVAFFDGHGTMRLTACTMKKDSTQLLNGGSILYSTFGAENRIELEDCYFEDCYGGAGSALFVQNDFYQVSEIENSSVLVSNCTFKNNTATNQIGGTITLQALTDSVQLTIEDCIFAGNIGRETGGALSLHNIGATRLRTDITSCQFNNNRVLRGSVGGALNVVGQSLITPNSKVEIHVNNSLFYGNDGTLHHQDYQSSTTSIDFLQCSFYQNGGRPFWKSTNAVDSSKLIGSQVRFENSIIWEPELSTLALFRNGRFEVPTLSGYQLNHCLLSLERCQAAGANEACLGGLLFNQDPLFVDPTAGDFRLAGCSPALNRGKTSDRTTPLPSYDLRGRPRVLEDTVDLGSYERHRFRLEPLEVISPSCHDSQDGEITTIHNGVPPTRLSWIKDDSISGVATHALATGSYFFQIEDAFGCQDSLSIPLDAPDPMQVYNFAYPVVGAGTGALVIDTVLGGTPPFSYLWSTGEQTDSIGGLAPGLHGLTITDHNGCILVTSRFVPSVAVSTQDRISANSWGVSPNPIQSNQLIQISTQQLKIQTVRLLDIRGRILWSKSVLQSGYPINSLSPGIYFVQIIDSQGRIGLKKIVVGSP